jgi:hypothetical protein
MYTKVFSSFRRVQRPWADPRAACYAGSNRDFGAMTNGVARDAIWAPATRWTRAWLLLLAACVLVVGAVDATLFVLSSSFFTSGFNEMYVDGFLWYGAYVVASVVLDLALVLGTWALCLPLLALLRAGRLQTLVLAGVLGTGVSLFMAAARYNLYAVLGNMASVWLLREVARGSSTAMVAEIFEQMEATELLIPLFVLVIVLVLTIAARRIEGRFVDVERRFAPPPLRSVFTAFASCALLGALVVVLPSDTMERLRYALRGKLSRIALAEVIERVSDVDRDGYGWLARPPDPAPFDGAVRPYAIDVPGNGVDENGIGGDHPLAFEPTPVAAAPMPAGEERPDFLLIFLETFRADLLGARLGGREITPYLNRLAREGASSSRAFVHCPATIPSRAQLFVGSLSFRGADSTLIDDFKDLGYGVGYFSGQDDSFGDSESLLGLDRADVFYDARRDVTKRTSRSTLAPSLQVSWKTVLSRVREFLAEVDPDEPLFLYVNFTDAHFPYVHDEMDPILDVEPITSSDIRAENAEKVRQAYANAAANVDRAVEELIDTWRTHLEGRDHAILVTADHGQAFYEKGFLGHGQALDDAQARIPLILWGIGGDWPEPLGLADIRGLLRRNLEVGRGGEVPVARFVPDPERRILQWAANVRRPHLVGLRGLEELVLYDFGKERLVALTPEEEPVHLSPEEEQRELRTLIWNWEEVQRRDQSRKEIPKTEG